MVVVGVEPGSLGLEEEQWSQVELELAVALGLVSCMIQLGPEERHRHLQVELGEHHRHLQVEPGEHHKSPQQGLGELHRILELAGHCSCQQQGHHIQQRLGHHRFQQLGRHRYQQRGHHRCQCWLEERCSCRWKEIRSHWEQEPLQSGLCLQPPGSQEQSMEQKYVALEFI